MLGAALSALLLLVLPGPTNVVVAVEAARRGPRRGALCVPVVLAAYATTTTLLVLISALVDDLARHLAPWPRVLVAALLLHLSVKLWTAPGDVLPGGRGPTGLMAIFTVTLVNPKNLFLAWILRRAQDWQSRLVANAAALVVAISLSTLFWLLAGGAGRVLLGARASRFFSRVGAIVVLIAAGLLISGR